MCLPRRCHFALDAIDHFGIVYMLSTLHVPGMCYLIFLPVMHTRTAIQLLHRGSKSLVVPLDCRGAPPVPCMQMCYRHLCSREHTLSASRAVGGESPLLCREVPRTSHKPRSSSGRGGTAPSESAPGATRPAQVPQLERPRRAYPPVSAPQVRHGTWYPSQHVLLGPAVPFLVKYVCLRKP